MWMQYLIDMILQFRPHIRVGPYQRQLNYLSVFCRRLHADSHYTLSNRTTANNWWIRRAAAAQELEE